MVVLKVNSKLNFELSRIGYGGNSVWQKRSFMYEINSFSIIFYEVFHTLRPKESNVRPVFLEENTPAETGII